MGGTRMRCPMQSARPKAFTSAPFWRRDSTREALLRTTACMSCLSRLACSFLASSCCLNVRVFLVLEFGVEMRCGGVEGWLDVGEGVVGCMVEE